MSRGMKICMIIGAVLLAIGLLVTFVCVARGESLWDFVRFTGFREIHSTTISQRGDGRGVDFELPEGSLDGVTKLSIEMSVAEITVGTGGEPCVKTFGFPEGKVYYRVEGSTLRLWDDKKYDVDFGLDDSERRVEIVLPGATLSELDIDLGVGDVYVAGLELGELTADIGTGSLYLESLKASSLGASVGTGDFSGDGLDCERASVDVGVGNVWFDGLIARSGEFETGTGDAGLRLAEGEMYVVCTSGIGEASINGSRSDGMGGEVTRGDPDAPCKITVETGIGAAEAEVY